MKHFIDRANGEVFAYEADGSQDGIIPERLEPLSDEELGAIRKPKLTPAQVWESIKAERDYRTDQGGYKVGAKWFHSDQKSRSQQLGLARKADRIEAVAGDLGTVMQDAFGNPINWKTMDGSWVPMTATLAQQIVAAAEASDLSTHKAAEIHKAAMEVDPDPASYDFSGGWPASFSG